MKLRIGLQPKIIITMLLIGLMPLISVMIFTYRDSTFALQKATGITFQNLSEETATKATMLLRAEFEETRLLGRDHEITNLLATKNKLYDGLTFPEIEAKADRDALRWRSDEAFQRSILENKATESIKLFVEGEEYYHTGLFVTDKYGKLAASMSKFPVYDQTNSFWYEKIATSDKIYVGNPYFDSSSNSYVFDIAAPIIEHRTQARIGYLVMSHEVQGFFRDVTSVRVGITGHAMLANASGTILVCPIFAPLSHQVKPGLRSRITSNEPGWVVTDEGPHSLGKPNALAGYAPLNFENQKDNIISPAKFFVFLTQDPTETYTSPVGAFEPVYQVLVRVFSLGFLLMSVILILGIVVSRRISGPIHTLHRGAQIIGQGNLDYRFSVDTSDEIEDLAKEFNQMALNLKTSHEELLKWNQQLESEVEKRTGELQLAVGQLEKANKLKSQFLANVSHELRTPLNSVIGFAELLNDTSFGELSDEQKRFASNIYRSGRQLLQLISELLDLSKIEAGQMQLNLTRVDITNELKFIQDSIAPLAEKKNISVSVNVTSVIPQMVTDEGKFRQIMNNLLSNAIKFTENNGLVEVNVLFENDELHVEVKDNGIGISSANQIRIFEEFQQVDGSYSREFGGTGLGLTLTKKFVEMMGGNISVKSELEKGSSFSFILPKETKPKQTVEATLINSLKRTEPDVSVAAAAAPKEPLIIPNDTAFIQEGSSVLRRSSAPEVDIDSADINKAPKDEDQVGLKASEPMRSDDQTEDDRPLVLVIEDDPQSSQFISVVLTRANYAVATAFNGADGARLADELQPFAIMLDIGLPDISGWDVLKQLKENPRTADIPIVIATMHENKKTAFHIGVVDYMMKPIDFKALLGKFQNYMFLKKSKNRILAIVSNADSDFEHMKKAIEIDTSYAVIRAQTIQNLHNISEAGPPACLVLDICAGDASVLKLAHDVKQDALLRNIPMVLLSDKTIDEFSELAVDSQFQKVVRLGSTMEKDLLQELHHFEKIYPERSRFTDKDTGTLNRNYLVHKLQEESQKTFGTRSKFAVVLIGVDKIMQNTDDAKRRAKDVQEALIKMLMNKVRGAEVMSFNESTRFSVILPGSGVAEAIRVSSRVLEDISGIERSFFQNLKTGIVYTEIDHAALRAGYKDPEKVLGKLEAELSRIRSGGSNKVSFVDLR